MIHFLTNATVRSASDLLADFAACRSLRHLTDDDRETLVKTAFTHIPPPYKMPKATRLGYVCEDCGKPKSDYGSPYGKCSSCYQAKPREFVWTARAFEIALEDFGYCCDVCDAVTEIPVDRLEAATKRVLDNLDGKSHPVLCKGCSQLFLAFCTREFGRDGRSTRSEDFEKLNLAWIASNTKRAARAVALHHNAKDRRREPA